jgi:hypothetical protein
LIGCTRAEEARFLREPAFSESDVLPLFLAFGFNAELAVSPGKPEGQKGLNFQREGSVSGCATMHPERCRYLALRSLIKRETEAAVSRSRAAGERASPAVHISGDPEVANNSGHTSSFVWNWEMRCGRGEAR